MNYCKRTFILFTITEMCSLTLEYPWLEQNRQWKAKPSVYKRTRQLFLIRCKLIVVNSRQLDGNCSHTRGHWLRGWDNRTAAANKVHVDSDSFRRDRHQTVYGYLHYSTSSTRPTVHSVSRVVRHICGFTLHYPPSIYITALYLNIQSTALTSSTDLNRRQPQPRSSLEKTWWQNYGAFETARFRFSSRGLYASALSDQG
jgi:hypothetical protein